MENNAWDTHSETETDRVREGERESKNKREEQRMKEYLEHQDILSGVYCTEHALITWILIRIGCKNGQKSESNLRCNEIRISSDLISGCFRRSKWINKNVANQNKTIPENNLFTHRVCAENFIEKSFPYVLSPSQRDSENILEVLFEDSFSAAQWIKRLWRTIWTVLIFGEHSGPLKRVRARERMIFEFSTADPLKYAWVKHLISLRR